MTFGANDFARAARDDADNARVEAANAKLETKAQRLLDLTKRRDTYFRQSIMADRTMAVMLSLFLAELKAVPLTEATLALINLLEDDEGRGVVESLIHAGLVVVTGANPDRRTVGLTPLGSARMRSFISDYPDT
ncbi:hypothetical protein KK488_10685 [Sphingobium sp. H33]|uniref:Uncharacterized protein n=1 Tax=Sphingobium nicotianae TaxID=2782607 RepID=A0A9X1IRF4_9SPHN|nr:hypothetical protein [Sphingobium nicotianae]